MSESVSAFDHFVRHLRMQGCRCPLMWNGTIAVPATVCDRQEAGGPDRHRCHVLASFPELPAPPADSPAARAHATHVQCSDDSAT